MGQPRRSGGSPAFGVLLTALLALGGCGGGGANWTYGALVDAKALRGQSGERKLIHSVPDGPRAVELRLRADLEAGELMITVRDATGALRWERRLAGPVKELVEERLPAAVAGRWTVRLTYRDLTGRYDLRAVAR